MTLRIFAVFLCFFLWSGIAHASDEFPVFLQFGSDTTSPSIPTNLIATPVSTTQIDLVWASSTDNVKLSGYQVFRDALQIATTSLIPVYSDTGLTPSTTYTYFVTAFDSFGNISSSSTSTATTTLQIPVPPPPTASTTQGGGEKVELIPLPLEIIKLEVIPDIHSVVIRFETRGYVKPVLKWGKTTDYEVGSIEGKEFKKKHETTITGLNADTLYYFTIEGENYLGLYGVLTQSTFRTLPLVDVFAPSNVLNLRAVRDGNDVVLTWKNPPEPDFSHVRIVRNNRFYPSDAFDGAFVYEGSDEEVRDRGVAANEGTQYYTVYSYDELGNMSSGAVVAITIIQEGAVTPEPVREDLNELSLSLGDVYFEQEGSFLPVGVNGVDVDGSKQLTIKIPYDRLPENLKTILVTLTDINNGSSFSFILRVDAQKEWYSATLAPFGKEATYEFLLAVYDFKTSQIGYVSTFINSTIVHFEKEGFSFLSFLMDILSNNLFWFFLLILLLLIIAYQFIAGGRRKKYNKPMSI